MKKIAIITLLIPFLLLFIESCSMFCEKGRGKIVTETRELSNFDKIEIHGQGQVFLTKGSKPSIKLVIDSNLQKYIKAEVSGTKLEIYENKCIKEISEYKIYITTSSLSDLLVDGSVKLSCDSVFTTNELKIKSTTSGEISLNFDAENIKLDAEGSGLLKLNGRAANFNIESEGAGSVQAYGLLAKNVNFEVTGAGTCEISVSEKLSGEVTGSGKLYYQGNPKKVETNNTGTGIIQTRQQ